MKTLSLLTAGHIKDPILKKFKNVDHHKIVSIDPTPPSARLTHPVLRSVAIGEGCRLERWQSEQK